MLISFTFCKVDGDGISICIPCGKFSHKCTRWLIFPDTQRFCAIQIMRRQVFPNTMNRYSNRAMIHQSTRIRNCNLCFILIIGICISWVVMIHRKQGKLTIDRVYLEVIFINPMDCPENRLIFWINRR